MKKESPEAVEAYKIRIDALEIVNEAYRAKIEALEMLNRNLQFLRDAQSQVRTVQANPVSVRPTSSPFPAVNTGEKRGRGRPKGAMGKNKVEKPVVATGEKRGRGRPRKSEVAAAPVVKAIVAKAVQAPKVSAPPAKPGKKAKGTSITRLQLPLETRLREKMDGEGYNKATFRALTGILLCLFENGKATVSNLHEYIGGSRVTVVRHTATLKQMNLLVYVGSRKKGHYELTAQGKALHQNLVNA